MQHNAVQQENTGLEALQPESVVCDNVPRGNATAVRELNSRTAPRPTTQAERAVMHPDSYDPDWCYYHGTLVD